jgi:hypothetical protein
MAGLGEACPGSEPASRSPSNNVPSASQDQLHHEPICIPVGPKLLRPDVGSGFGREGVEDGPGHGSYRPVLLDRGSEVRADKVFRCAYDLRSPLHLHSGVGGQSRGQSGNLWPGPL